jgi:hypothetical protein
MQHVTRFTSHEPLQSAFSVPVAGLPFSQPCVPSSGSGGQALAISHPDLTLARRPRPTPSHQSIHRRRDLSDANLAWFSSCQQALLVPSLLPFLVLYSLSESPTRPAHGQPKVRYKDVCYCAESPRMSCHVSLDSTFCSSQGLLPLPHCTSFIISYSS